MMVASVILPLRHTYIHMPMNMPSGMVMATVNVPHTLSASALTNATPRPASATTRMRMIVIAATRPMDGLISCLTMSGSDRPPRRVEAHSTMPSWTAPARQHPATSQMNPGA